MFALLHCLCNYWMGGYGLVCGALDYGFVGFWDGDNVSQLPCVWDYVVVNNNFKHAREEWSAWCLVCQLLCLLFCCSRTWVVVSVILYYCIFCIDQSMDMFALCVAYLTVCVNCLGKQFAIFVCVVVILLQNVIKVLSVWGVGRCSVGYTIYGLPNSVCVVTVIPVCIWMLLA